MTGQPPTEPEHPTHAGETAAPSSGGDIFANWSAGGLLMALFLASLAVLFTASILGFVIVRYQQEDWPPAGVPPLPNILWLSTLLILATSIVVQVSVVTARAGKTRALAIASVITFALAVGFLIMQTVAWLPMIGAYQQLMEGDTPRPLYAGAFLFLTGLHAAHVIGGLIPLGIVTLKAARGRYTAENHQGVTYMAAYWHFLDVVWIVLFLVLLVTTAGAGG
jgi:cytochrome c oxidase subunit 3